ncbi:nucleosidase [Amniculibacterium sp. G2-70]|jgi:adenosylhomocysteine nucleosidase|uniref:5'-methylthioadenosine/S-adenosylhomocysteine nucleosidase family protein n=1 Tax=Amniculibacterium sp. G2-70 TaxID=2767188 RepID=UPI00165480EF|nr:nucleosidase [Amniculibacterium sp. G2-70]
MKKITLKKSEFQRPLFVFAMKEEAVNLFDDYQLIFTGLGKINASYELTKAIAKYAPDIIINLGTAGSTLFNRGEVVCCNQFVQRDMDVSALGFEKFKTPFAKEESILKYGLELDELNLGTCGTGDSFETEHRNTEYNVVDMEAYALAAIAQREQIPFLCLKYISDGADDNAVDDWNEGVKKAAKALKSSLGLD